MDEEMLEGDDRKDLEKRNKKQDKGREKREFLENLELEIIEVGKRREEGRLEFEEVEGKLKEGERKERWRKVGEFKYNKWFGQIVEVGYQNI